MLALSNEFITTIISATSVIIGSLIGGICSWVITKHSLRKNVEIQYQLVKDNREYDKSKKIGELYENINIVRLDIFTGMFQCVRNIKYLKKNESLTKYPIPIYQEYPKALSSLNIIFTLKEMSYIYQLYGIMENINKHVSETTIYNNENFNLLKKDCLELLKKVYGKNYKKILEIDIENTEYKKLYENNFIKKGYKNVLKKIDKNFYIKNEKMK